MDDYQDLLDVVETRTKKSRSTKIFERVSTSMLLFMSERLPESLGRIIHTLDVDPVVTFHLLTCERGIVRNNLLLWKEWDKSFVPGSYDYLEALATVAGQPKGKINQTERVISVTEIVNTGKFKSRPELCRNIVSRYDNTKSAKKYHDTYEKLWADEVRYLLHSRAVKIGLQNQPYIYDSGTIVCKKHHKRSSSDLGEFSHICYGLFDEYSADAINEMFSVIRTYPGEDYENELVILNADVPDVGGDIFQVAKQFVFSSDFMYRLDLTQHSEKMTEIINSEGGINYFVNFQSIFL